MNGATKAVVTAATLTGLALGVLILRCVSRFIILKRFGPEDYLILLAFVLSSGFTAIVVLFRKYGMGKDTKDLTKSESETLYKLLYASIIIYNTGLLFIKLSPLCQYLRFLTEKVYQLSAKALIFGLSFAVPTFAFTSAFSCWPVAHYWENPEKDQHCINHLAFWYAFSGFHIATDLAVWMLPMPVLMRLNLPKRQKISLIAVFVLGGFACITAILRLECLHSAYQAPNPVSGHAKVAMWSAVELNVGMICACLPTIRPLISLLFPSTKFETHHEDINPGFSAQTRLVKDDSKIEMNQLSP